MGWKDFMNTNLGAKVKETKEEIDNVKLDIDSFKNKINDYSRKEIDTSFIDRFTRMVYANPFKLGSLEAIQFIMFVALIYFYNPLNINTKYPAFTQLLIITVAFIYVILFFYIKVKTEAGKDVDLDYTTESGLLKKVIATLVCFILFILVIKGVLWLFMNTALVNVLRHLTTVFIIVGILGLIYIYMKKSINKVKNAPERTLTSLILKVILYLPCLLVDIIEYIKYEFNLAPKPIWILLGVEGGFIGLWLIIPYLFQKISNYDGTILLNAPINLNKEHTIGDFKILHEGRNLLVDNDTSNVNKYYNAIDTNFVDSSNMNNESSCQQMDASGNLSPECINAVWKEYGCTNKINYNNISGVGVINGTLNGTTFQVNVDASNQTVDELKSRIKSNITAHPDWCAAVSTPSSYSDSSTDYKFTDASGNSVDALGYTDPHIPKNEILAWFYKKLNHVPIPNITTSVHPQYTDSNTKRFSYTYSLSGWFYINPQSPSTGTAYTKYTNILKYGNQVNIEYNAQLNSLRVMGDVASPENDTVNKNVSVQIYESKQVLYQKWNNIVINYDNGFLDVFLNGNLVGSKSGVAPYMRFDTIVVGAKNGIQGGICNVNYYENILKKSEINLRYKSLRDKELPYIWSIKDDININIQKRKYEKKGLVEDVKRFLNIA